MVDVSMKFHVPAVWNGAPVSVLEKDDRVIFEGVEYEVIRVQTHSGGTLTGSQMAYITLFTRRIETTWTHRKSRSMEGPFSYMQKKYFE